MDIQAPLFEGAPVIHAVRFILLWVAAYNMVWSFAGLRGIRKEGSHFATSVLKSGIFFISAGTAALQILVLTNNSIGAVSAWALVCFVSLLGGHIYLAYMNRSGIIAKLDTFFNFYPYVDKALPIIELAAFDPVRAESIHKLTVDALVEALMEDARVARVGEQPPDA